MEQIAKTLEEFLGEHELLFPVDGYMLDKMRIPNHTTLRNLEKMYKECKLSSDTYHDKRNAAIAEYNALVVSGHIRDKTPLERRIEVANGHPDNESVQAARRLLEKQGIIWDKNVTET
ncbi:MAG: hypothetical protein WC389_22175 [Lutibacter sp.]|jgi:hypothetical protein